MNLHELLDLKHQQRRPKVICLCGSTRFGETFQQAMLSETLAGHVVLSIGCHKHGDEALGLSQEELDALDILLNVNGYVGESTQREIQYATDQGKSLRYLERKQA